MWKKEDVILVLVQTTITFLKNLSGTMICAGTLCDAYSGRNAGIGIINDHWEYC